MAMFFPKIYDKYISRLLTKKIFFVEDKCYLKEQEWTSNRFS